MKVVCLILSFAVVFSTPVLSQTTEPTTSSSANPSSSAPEQALLDWIDTAQFESLFDIPLQLSPDWQVATPTKVAKRSSRSPASVQVISKEQISRFGYHSLSEVLGYISGFSATDDLVQSNFGIRGIHPGLRAGNRSFKVMIDDQPIGFQSTDSQFIDQNLIPMAMVERIEIIKGPVSALYGANAFLGVINIVSKNADDYIRKGQFVQLSLNHIENGGFGYGYQLVGGGRWQGWSTSLGISGGYNDRAGLELPQSSPDYSDFANQEPRQISARRDDQRPLAVYLKSRYGGSDNSQWQLAVHYQNLNADNVFSDLNPLQQSGNSVVDLYNGFIRLDHSRQINPQVSASVSLALKKGGPNDADRVELGSEQFYYRRQLSYRSYETTAQLSWQPNDGQNWLFGADFITDQHHLETFSRVEKDSGKVTPLSEPHSQDLDRFGLYGQWLSQWQYQWLPSSLRKIETIVGFRFDKSDVYRGQNAVRLGLVYPLATDHSVKLLWGSSYQAPSAELLFRRPIQRGDVIGNEDLAVQNARTIELVFSGLLTSNIRYNASIYRSSIDDLVIYKDEFNNRKAVNSGHGSSTGIEFDVSYDSDLWHLYFNVSGQRVGLEKQSLFSLENRDEGELFPHWQSNLGVSYRFEGDYTVSLDSHYSAKQPASTSNVLAAEAVYHLDSYFTSSLTLQKTWQGLFEVEFQIKDLWQSEHVNPGFGGIDIPSIGRQYILSVSKRF